jgi:signal transduction histidine kinase
MPQEETPRAEDALPADALPSPVFAALEGGLVGLWWYDLARDVLRWSDSMCRMCGVAPADAPTTYEGWRRFVHPDDVERVEHLTRETLAIGHYPDLEHRLVLPSGEVRHVLSKAKPISAEDEDGRSRIVELAGCLVDVTTRRRVEAARAEATRLDGIARLAGGIAHDFNNMLTVILGSTNIAIEVAERGALEPSAPLEAPELDEIMANLVAVRDAAERCAKLTHRLLIFARRAPASPRPIELAEFIRQREDDVRALLGPTIDLVLELTPCPIVRADASQLELVVTQLANNAREAMLSGGTLTLRTGTTLLDGRRHVRLDAIDTGRGIDPSALELVFEPFYSTRGPFDGAGLGLAAVHGIVRQHGGHIDVRSTPGVGTTFTIDLPVADS